MWDLTVLIPDYFLSFYLVTETHTHTHIYICGAENHLLPRTGVNSNI